MPVADLESVAVTAARARPAQLIRPLQPAAASATGSSRHSAAPLADPSLPPVVVVPDAEMPLPDVMAALQRLPRQVYMLLMPPLEQMAQLRSVSALADLFCAAVHSTVPAGPLVVAGIGAGGVVAHEMAVQLQKAGQQVRCWLGCVWPASMLMKWCCVCPAQCHTNPSTVRRKKKAVTKALFSQQSSAGAVLCRAVQVPVLLLLENAPLREAAAAVSQPWFRLYPFLSTWRSDVDMEAWCHTTKGLAAHPQGFQRQLDAIAALRPEHVPATHWSMLVEDRLRQAARSGYQWEELLSSWVALYCKIAQQQQVSAAARAEAAKQRQGSQEAAGSQAEAAARQLPEFDAFLLHMFALEADPQAQLDYVAEFKPAAMSEGNWDTEVGKVRSNNTTMW